VIREPIAPTTTPGAVIDHERLLAALRECLQLLPAAMRETVELRFQDNLSYEEMAIVMNTKPGTLNKRVDRGLQHLLDCLEGKGWQGWNDE